MSYTAIARRWRPKTFADMEGQEHVIKALSNALTGNRVHHAFLFTGTRGVGKTTVARILAKCLNCERGMSATPCGECAACREIDTGRFVDLIEVDAASRTKIDDTRELLENVQYAPTRGRYKIYLIDEVHMLSTHSFNALLKTLEEPPPHVKFLLATTDPQKLPVTVLSRCLQFNLKPLPVATIVHNLTHILEADKLAFEPAALRLVAIAAAGSLRDAQSLLDQLLVFGGGKATEADARAMLGTIDRAHVVALVELLAKQDAAGLMQQAARLEEWAPDHAQLLDDMAALLARLALRQAIPGYDGDELHPPELLERLAAGFSAEDLQLYYQIALLGRRDLPLAPDPRTGLEMTLLRMLAFRPGSVPAGQSGSADGARGATAGRSAAAPSRAAPATNATASAASPVPAPEASAATAIRGELTPASWESVVQQHVPQGMTRQLAANCEFVRREGNLLHLLLDPRKQVVRTPQQEEKLAQALSSYLGEAVRLQFDVAETVAPATPARADERRGDERQSAALASLESDPAVLALQQRFGATLQPDSVRPAGARPGARGATPMPTKES